MAQFCARVRKQPDLPAVSIKDIYQNPTISALAAALAPAEEATATVQVQVQDRLAEVLSGVLGIEHVPVDANFFDDLGADSLVMAKFCARVRKQPDLPSVSIKDIYQNPTISALAAALAPAEETTATAQVQERLAEVLAGVLGVEQVPVDDDFFQDLGADSLVMAQFCARVRKQPDLPQVSMKEIYGNPNISALAAALQVPPQQDKEAEPSPAVASVPETPPPMDARTWEYVTCGALQVLVYIGYCLVAGLIAVVGYQWVFPDAGPGNHDWVEPWDELLGDLPAVDRLRRCGVRAAVHPAGGRQVDFRRALPAPGDPHLEHGLLPVLAGQGLDAHLAPLADGRFAADDLLPEGHGREGRPQRDDHDQSAADLHRPAHDRGGDGDPQGRLLNGYRAHGGVIQLGGVTLGRDVTIGEGSVLDIDTSMGDGSQLGHRSTLYTGQAVPEGERWHGSPGRRTDADYATVEPTPYRPWRRGWFAVSQLLSTLGLGRIHVGTGVTWSSWRTRTWRRFWSRRRWRSPTGSSTPTPSPTPAWPSSVERSWRCSSSRPCRGCSSSR